MISRSAGRPGDLPHRALLLVAVAAVAAVAWELLDRLARGLVVPLQLVDPYGHGAADIAGQPSGTGATAVETTVQLHVDNAPAWLRLAAGGQPLLTFLAVALGAWALAGVVRSVAAGRPYDARNPARLAGIAIAVVLGGVLAPLTDLLARNAVIDRLQADDVLTARFDPGYLPVLVAGGIVVCAEAVRRGCVGVRIPERQPTA